MAWSVGHFADSVNIADIFKNYVNFLNIQSKSLVCICHHFRHCQANDKPQGNELAIAIWKRIYLKQQ